MSLDHQTCIALPDDLISSSTQTTLTVAETFDQQQSLAMALGRMLDIIDGGGPNQPFTVRQTCRNRKLDQYPEH